MPTPYAWHQTAVKSSCFAPVASECCPNAGGCCHPTSIPSFPGQTRCLTERCVFHGCVHGVDFIGHKEYHPLDAGKSRWRNIFGHLEFETSFIVNPAESNIPRTLASLDDVTTPATTSPVVWRTVVELQIY